VDAVMTLLHEFNLPITLKDNFILPAITTKYKIEIYKKEHILNSSTIDFFENSHLHIREVQLFVSSPMYFGTIHIDGHTANTELGCVNYVINNDLKWKMQWFKLKENVEFVKKVSMGNTDYMSFGIAECDIIENTVFEKAALINVSVPHKIINLSRNPRYCLSLRFFDNKFDSILNKLNEINAKI
jgi:hypothetical protein